MTPRWPDLNNSCLLMPTQPDRARPKRWLIDTNVWSGVADASLGSDLAKAARRKRIEILAASSQLFPLSSFDCLHPLHLKKANALIATQPHRPSARTAPIQSSV